MSWTVTLKDLRKAGACVEGYNKVVCALSGKEFNSNRKTYIRFKHDKPIEILSIFDSNGFDDALWATRYVTGHDRDLRLFAVWCARQVPHLMDNRQSVDVINVAERHANGLATDCDLYAARDAADPDAWAAAWYAARGAAWGAARTSQQQMFVYMLNGAAPWQTDK